MAVVGKGKIYLHPQLMYLGESMGTITVALKPETERLLRLLAKRKHGGKKGALSKVLEEGLQHLELDERRKAAIDRQLKVMRKGFSLGIKKFERKMAYE